MKSALTKIQSLAVADMKRFWRDPTALFFTIFFPLIFLLIFGAIFGSDSEFSDKIAFQNESDSALAIQVEERIIDNPSIEIVEYETEEELDDALVRSQIRAIINIPEDFGEQQNPGQPSFVDFDYLASEETNIQALLALVNSEILELNLEIEPYVPAVVVAPDPLAKDSLDGLDYLVSGIMGFAILGLAIFGMANGFTSDKKTGAIARLRSAPISAYHIVVSTAIVYAILAVISVALLVVAAMVLFDFDMIGDWFSFVAYVMISTVSLLGIGVIIGGWAKNDKQAAPLAQLVAFPMLFLSGVFFPVFLMPEWLQTISKFIPLTPVNDGLRLISSEAVPITQLGTEILVLIAWGVGSYLIAFRVFRWE